MINLYKIAANTAERIKLIAKSKGISVKEMLEACHLNKNTLSSMLSRGSWPQANNLGFIADYLDCSVDYLLGRTDNPEINRGSENIHIICIIMYKRKWKLIHLHKMNKKIDRENSPFYNLNDTKNES